MGKEYFSKLSKNGIWGKQQYMVTNKTALKMISKYVGRDDSHYFDGKGRSCIKWVRA